jgi:hypothetical protein
LQAELPMKNQINQNNNINININNNLPKMDMNSNTVTNVIYKITVAKIKIYSEKSTKLQV